MSEPVTDERTWEDEETLQEEPEPIVRRPRRRLLTPATALLFALLLGAGGFIAGVQVEKGEVSNSASSRGAGRLAGLLGAAGGSAAASGTAGARGSVAGGGGGAGGRGFAAAGGAGATIGQVEYVSGADLYVTNLEGNTVKVLTDGAQITKQVNSTVKGVHPGDTVIVQGATHSNGSVQAATVRDSGNSGTGGADAALFGGGSGSSGGNGGSGGSSSGSTSSTGGARSSGGSTGEPALFGK
jgi:hypothetical protein